MKMPAVIIAAFSLTTFAGEKSQIYELRLPPPPELTRADLYVALTVPHPRAVLVLCPGVNGNGQGLLKPAWIEFANQHQLGLIALSFASPKEDLKDGRGYYHPSRGAGKTFLAGLRVIYEHDLPVLLYGISGGAHFTAGFVEWKPERVISWCAYTAGWWDLPKAAKSNPPGIVACGEEDVRYGASLGYFLQGRALGKPWTWVSLAKTGHQSSPALDEFVRTYFAAILDSKTERVEWRDVDLKCPIDSRSVTSRPTLACWLPNGSVAQSWMKIHQP